MTGPLDEQIREQRLAITRYYRIHARIYDLTRWSYLKGRKALLRRVAARFHPTRILEVGCGTGRNLLQLGHRFPQAELWGLDLSADMLSVAVKKLHAMLPFYLRLGPREDKAVRTYRRGHCPGSGGVDSWVPGLPLLGACLWRGRAGDSLKGSD
jgi:SAM-dependent methyltransferase